METTELIEALSRGEDSRHQFKENFTNADALAAEIVPSAIPQAGRFSLVCKTTARSWACLIRTSNA
jgi:hypothetical protein